LMMREFLPTTGKILVDKEDIVGLQAKKLPELRRKIGAVWQDFKLLWDRTVGENIGLTLEILGHEEKEIVKHVRQLLELVGMSNKEDLFPAQISGGELQRTVIARALASKPKILFADEPTGNLDEITAMQIMKLLKDINELGTTVLVATHNEALVEKLGKRKLTLEKGKLIVDEGTDGKK